VLGGEIPSFKSSLRAVANEVHVSKPEMSTTIVGEKYATQVWN